MDEDGRLGIRNLPFYDQPIKEEGLGFQLFHNAGFFQRECAAPGHPMPMVEYGRNGWSYPKDKFMHLLPLNQGSPVPNAAGPHAFQMIQQPDPLKEERPPLIEDPIGRKDPPLKKRSQGRAFKAPKTKKPKKVAAPREDSAKRLASGGRTANRSTGLVINDIDVDISGIPTPVCSCTGAPQQCYRWGIGGWQSACCTTNINEYPLPMNVKKKGTRISGRKMSQGAFKKVLEKLAGEGFNLSVAIDLKTYWAKHGTNKFVTIR